MFDHSRLYTTAAALLTKGKGILAADQSIGTINKQLKAIGVPEEAEMRRLYRQLLFTTSGIEQYVSGIILYDSTIRNHTDDGTPFVDHLIAKGIIPIIKVDKGTVPHTNFAGEVVTQGLDDLADRLEEYYEMGARAAKWRAVFTIGEDVPTEQNMQIDAVTLARYAALCQAAGLVPIVEPEVLYSGEHTIEQAEAVTTHVLRTVFDQLSWQRVDLRGVILKSSMVLAGDQHSDQSTPAEVAEASLRTFAAAVPQEVPGIVFLSGGQSPKQATANLDAMAELEKSQGGLPWEVAFSFSRALEGPVQQTWRGDPANVPAAQKELLARLKLNCLADSGDYEASMETTD